MPNIDDLWKQAFKEIEPTYEELRCQMCYEQYLNRVAAHVEKLRRGPTSPEQQALMEYENAPW